MPGRKSPVNPHPGRLSAAVCARLPLLISHREGTRRSVSPQVDTVTHASATPEVVQPYKELGLKEDEYVRIKEILGRRSTDAELAMYSVMWS